MEYAQLGKSSLNISRIGFGCMSLKQEAASEILINDAIEKGINFFDTADLYNKGDNEILVGKAIGKKRKDVIIATKGGNQWNEDGTTWRWNASPRYLETTIEKSLQRLGTDYIDLYQLHGGTMEDPIEEIIGTFESFVQQGKIRFYGISSIRPNVIDRWLKISRLTSVMMQYSLLDRRPEENCLPLLQKNNVGVLARGSLAQGLLLSKPAKEYLGHSEGSVRSISSALQKLSSENTPESLATGFVLRHPAITSAIIGIRTYAHLNQALQSANGLPLSEQQYQVLKKISPPNFYEQHRL